MATNTGHHPRLSIGMPVYNGSLYLAAALDSLLAQTFTDFEIFVCDNASTDQTPAIVAEYSARDPRVRYVRNERNIGANANFNRVAGLATAPLFKWAAHDDIYEPTYLERCVALLEADPGVVLAHADAVFIDQTGARFLKAPESHVWVEPHSRARYRADPVDLAEVGSPVRRFGHVLFSSLWGTHVFGVMRASALRSTGLIQNVPSSDRPLLAELALLGRFACVREPLYLKRFHPGMTTGLSAAATRAYVGTDLSGYAVRTRQLRVFWEAPDRKSLAWLERVTCRGMVLAYGAKVALRSSLGLNHQSISPAAESGARPEFPASKPDNIVGRRP